MRAFSLTVTFLFLGGVGGVAEIPTSYKDASISDLENVVEQIDAELESLAELTLSRGVGAASYSSKHTGQAETAHTFRVELLKEERVDQVVLVPALWNDPSAGVRSEGFPVAFDVIVGIDKEEHKVASIKEEVSSGTRIAPLVIDFPPVVASWVRLEIREIPPNIGKHSYSFQLSELLVFNGERNVALHTIKRDDSRAFLVTDGFVPYVMDAAQGELPHRNIFSINEGSTPPYLILDLGKPTAIEQVNLHTENVTAVLTIPMRSFDSEPTPSGIKLVGALSSDFSDERELFKIKLRRANDIGHIYKYRFPVTECRYVKLIILDHSPVASLTENYPYFAYGEIEVLLNGENKALGSVTSASKNLTYSQPFLKGLTDGYNYYGKVLSSREWMNQLSRRHDLEQIKPLIVLELTHRYAKQKKTLRTVLWGTALLLLGAALLISQVRWNHLKKMRRYRERMAADLHDELGANLHAIALLSDLAQGAEERPKDLQGYLKRIRAMTSRSSQAVQSMSTMNESSELFSGLRREMKRAAERILTQVEHEFSVKGEEHLPKVKDRVKVDIFLFYKECLINACRHSNATEIQTLLRVTSSDLTLTVKDNGQGLPPTLKEKKPRSLQRRADMLKGKLLLERREKGGISITLKVPIKKNYSL